MLLLPKNRCWLLVLLLILFPGPCGIMLFIVAPIMYRRWRKKFIYVWYMNTDQIYKCAQFIENGGAEEQFNELLLAIKSQAKISARNYLFSRWAEREALRHIDNVFTKAISIATFEDAIKLYHFAAGKKEMWRPKKKPSMDALFKLSRMYKIGLGVKKSEAKAKRLFNKGAKLVEESAKAGDVKMMLKLAEIYAEQNETKLALYWAQKASFKD